MNWKIPSLEEIYNECHKQKFFYRTGIYPRAIKNFSAIENPKNKEYLLRFQNLIKRNRNSINWKLYIQALAELSNGTFNISVLGTLKGTKLYRGYVEYKQKKELADIEILNEVKRSLAAIVNYNDSQDIKMKDYFYQNFETSPIALQHIFSDIVSPYFYAIFPTNMAYSLLNYQDDCFYDLFQCNKNEFFDNIINPLHDYSLKFKLIQDTAIKFEIAFKKI